MTEPTITVDAATGDGWDLIGAAIRKAGTEDASGARRAVAGALQNRDYHAAARLIGCSEDDARELRAALVAVWGEPGARISDG